MSQLDIATVRSGNFEPLFEIFSRSLRADELGYRLHVQALDLSGWPEHRFGSDSWHHAVRAKMGHILTSLDRIAGHGYLIFSDADVQFFRPEQLPDLVADATAHGLDFYGMREGNSRDYNTGFMVLRNTPAIRRMVALVAEALGHERPHLGDQALINDLLRRRDSGIRHAAIAPQRYVWGSGPIHAGVLFHHAVCGETIAEKLTQMRHVAACVHRDPTLPAHITADAADDTRRSLVVVRAGDHSLHPRWLGDGPRPWDIAVSCYGGDPERHRDTCILLHECPGPKFAGLADFVAKHASLIARYEFVWFPDDDLLASARTISEFFAVCRRARLAVAQPALTPSSPHTWPITLQRCEGDLRVTNFVEVMAPCFQVAQFHHFAPTFALSDSGWGLEWVWADVAARQSGLRMGIVDATPIRHTRPVGAGSRGAVTPPAEEMQALLERLSLRKTRPETLEVARFQRP